MLQPLICFCTVSCCSYPETIFPSLHVSGLQGNWWRCLFKTKQQDVDSPWAFVHKIGHRKNTFHFTIGETPAGTFERDGKRCPLSFHSCILCLSRMKFKDHVDYQRMSHLHFLSITTLLVWLVLPFFLPMFDFWQPYAFSFSFSFWEMSQKYGKLLFSQTIKSFQWIHIIYIFQYLKNDE